MARWSNGRSRKAAKAVSAVRREHARFLLLGRRRDLTLTGKLDFADGWETQLRERAKTQGKLHGPTGLDYFVFVRGSVGGLPPFAIGRPGWDNWLVYRARALGLPIIDATQRVLVVHQNHDYGHHPGKMAGMFKGPEAQANATLMGGMLQGYTRALTARDADQTLTPNGLTPNRSLYRHYRALVKRSESDRRLRLVVILVRAVRRSWSGLLSAVRKLIQGDHNVLVD